MSDLLLKSFDPEPNANVKAVSVGDSVTVHVRVNVGERNERVQIIRGLVIRKRKGGVDENFTVRRIASNGIGVELNFLTHSPRIEKIEIHRSGHVRQAQIYYMRERRGKSARLREKRAN